MVGANSRVEHPDPLSLWSVGWFDHLRHYSAAGDWRRARVEVVPMAAVLAARLAVVRGRSMEPTLRDGDRLLVRLRRPACAPGGCVVVRLPGRPVVAVKRATRAGADGLVGRARQPARGRRLLVGGGDPRARRARRVVLAAAVAAAPQSHADPSGLAGHGAVDVAG